MARMRFDVVTLFPEMIGSAAHYGVTGRAIERGIVDLCTWNPRDYTSDRHRTVDDRPYGGGPGMLMKYQPLQDVVEQARKAAVDDARVVYLSPQGRLIDQQLLEMVGTQRRLILVAGRYEGVDQRFMEACCDEEWSLGDFVISGGELAALLVIDAITRLLPGVLGDENSARQDSYMNGLLDCPHYTRPEVVDGMAVPAVLLSGDHARIGRWRMKQALGRTWKRRPDLLEKMHMTAEQQTLLNEFKTECEV